MDSRTWVKQERKKKKKCNKKWKPSVGWTSDWQPIILPNEEHCREIYFLKPGDYLGIERAISWFVVDSLCLCVSIFFNLTLKECCRKNTESNKRDERKSGTRLFFFMVWEYICRLADERKQFISLHNRGAPLRVLQMCVSLAFMVCRKKASCGVRWCATSAPAAETSLV